MNESMGNRFYSFSKGDMNKLQILQNKVLRLRSNQNKYTPVTTLLKICNEMSVNQLGAFHSLLTLHKAVHENKPKYISDKLSSRAPNGNEIFPMRQQNKVFLPNYRLTVSRGSFCYRSAKLWNNMPPYLREITPYKLFKLKLELMDSHKYSHKTIIMKAILYIIQL